MDDLRRGITILDLIGWPAVGAPGVLPPEIAQLLEGYRVLDLQSSQSPGAFIYHGIVQRPDGKLPPVNNRSAKAPGLEYGVPFQLSYAREPLGAGNNVEPVPVGWSLDLFFERVEIGMPFRAAELIPADGVHVAHLKALDPKRPSDPLPKTNLVVRAVFRIQMRDDGTIALNFSDRPDPFYPDAPSGPVVECWLEPPHFVVGPVGITVQRVTIDASETFTPAEIIDRGQDAAWMGVAVEEATVYLPGNTP